MWTGAAESAGQGQSRLRARLGLGPAESVTGVEAVARLSRCEALTLLLMRFAQAALEEMMSDFGGGEPSAMHERLHAAWAEGGWGLVISGEPHLSGPTLLVQADAHHRLCACRQCTN